MANNSRASRSQYSEVHLTPKERNTSCEDQNNAGVEGTLCIVDQTEATNFDH